MMSRIGKDLRTKAQVLEENEELRRRLEEAEQTLEAIRSGNVDALVVADSHGEHIYTLTGAEHVYRVVVETMNEAALTVDLDGTILFCNQRFCDLMKTPMQKTLGRNIMGFAARPQQAPLKRLMTDAQADPVQRRITLQAADGTMVPVQISASLLPANGATSVCLVASDLTELEASANSIRVLREHQEALEASEARFRAIFESSQDAVILVDDDGVSIQANPAVETVFALPAEQLIGHRLPEFVDDPADFASIWRAFLGTGALRAELKVTDAHGQVRDVDCYAVANILPGWHLAVIRDITERKRAEEALQEANGQLRVYTEELRIQAEELHTQTEELKVANEELIVSEHALRNSETRRTIAMSAGGLGAWETDLVSGRTSWDEQIAILLGIAPDQRSEFSDAWLDFVHPQDRPRVVEQFQAAVEGRAPYDTSFRMRRADGEERWFATKGRLIHDARGAPVRVVGIAQDITERKCAEEALRRSEERFRALATASSQALYRMSPDWSEMCWLDSRGFLVGTERPDRTWLEKYIRPDDQPRVTAIIQEAIRTKSIFEMEHRVRRADGSLGWTFSRAVPLMDAGGEIVEWFGAASDVTERKQAEEALRESEQRYHRLFEDDLTGNFISTPEGQILLCNPAFAMTFGFSDVQEAVGTSMLDLYVDPRERQSMLEKLRQEGKLERLEVWRKRRDGQPIYIVENLIGHFNDRGELDEIKGYVFDDTERKRAEEALRESEERFRTLADNMSQFAWMTDETGWIFWYNQRWYEYTGTTLEEMQGWGWQKVHHPDHVQRVVEKFRYHIENGLVWEDTFPLRGKDGEYRWFLSRAIPIRDEQGRIVRWFGTNTDITKRKVAEEALRELTRTLETRVAERTRELEFRARQLQKLALELSQAEDRERRRLAEILHDDLQQQLAAVKFHLGILAGRAKGDAAMRASTAQLDGMLKDAIETSRSLSHELSPAVMYHGDMGEIFEWLAHQIQTKHGMIVRVEPVGQIEVESDALKVFLFKAVQEMLFNAVKHARVGEAKVRVRRRGRYVSLCISDRGRGFDPQDLKQTAGFGLMSIRERIGLLGGRMRIHSVKGEGSRFIITVPDGQTVVGAPARGRPLEDRTAEESTTFEEGGYGGRPLRVLIADDHEIVRHGLASLLAETEDIELVGQAGNGREAVDMAYHLRPDVVIMDVAMPLINGDEATRQILRHLPQTRIVALSMYDEAGAIERMNRAGAESYVLKTAPSDELLAAVRGKPR
jgi:PAS domain S-box-containing protein